MLPHPVKNDRHARGFSLIELLVALTIIGLLMGLVGPRVVGYLSDAKSDTARAQVENLAASLDLFLIDMGRYPTKDEGLGALIENPGTLSEWDGPYLRKQVIPNDPWGRSYLYDVSPGGDQARVRTLGADGTEGGDAENADITS